VEEDLDLGVPVELVAGVYADRLNSWFTRHQLVPDFITFATDDELLATARVRVPATAVLDVLSSLAECVARYELEFGEIHRPRRRGEEWSDESE
jgi:hypothetical protein